MRLRELALHGKANQANREEMRRGRKLLTKKQHEYLKNKTKENIFKRQENLMQAHEEKYFESLKERGVL